jgi:hypothetical protein
MFLILNFFGVVSCLCLKISLGDHDIFLSKFLWGTKMFFSQNFFGGSRYFSLKISLGDQDVFDTKFVWGTKIFFVFYFWPPCTLKMSQFLFCWQNADPKICPTLQVKYNLLKRDLPGRTKLFECVLR